MENSSYFICENLLLEQDRYLDLTEFNIEPTYSGIYIGNPTFERNLELIKKAMPEDNTSRFTHIVPPAKSLIETELPPMKCTAMFQDDFKMLQVIWFTDHPNGKTIKEVAQEIITKLDWDKVAQDLEF